MLFGFQPDDTAVAPNGQIYLPKPIYSDDFSSELLAEARLFIHEMTHVWQYQLGYAVRRTRAVRPNMSYDYVLDEEKRLCDYNMEAQGNILADYFLLEFRNAPNFLYERQYANSADAITRYRRTLDAFLRNPGSKENLPNVTR
ncbi:hypothetical protein [Luteimonas sp. R10]|uniref:hypothetical protein n=1 Tax=Luteimonas sp. R10 TaxID=3108176 RepID=UPI00308C0701|nr:hypothetical protein U3649_05045 [Luteimonas sp. R10]